MIQFHYGGGGALVCDEPIEGVTQDLLTVSEAHGEESVKFYGGRYFIAESMHRSAAKRMAELLGGVLADDR
jgi:hypothetical protein